MPGIHVRTSGRDDYIEREKEPILTVPGSYWLCHKKNIYKFTFKYHRNSRDAKSFNYGKELMKVIRRIIKSQPRQGQQFGTHHLLVTYNHTSWTRQDKMFAMLKFRDRTDASAFPRAFILTVKILISIPSPSNDDEYDDDLIVYKKYSDNSRLNNSQQHNSNTNSNEISHEEHHVSTSSNDETSNDSSSRLTPINSTNITVNDNLPTSKITKHSKDQLKKNTTASFFSDLDDLPLLERYLLEQKDEPEKLKSLKTSISSISNIQQECLNEIQETIDMPYQYLIEREIELTKKHIINNSNEQKNTMPNIITDKLVVENSSENLSPRNRLNSTHIIDNATSRSANITDLVMEGLMFTIRQDQDTITVMEQKTKLEPDEVLENSEKVETKEGGECLVNSSLLKLENLITKIERSSSAVKSMPHIEQNYKNTFLRSPFYSVDGNFTGNNEIFSNRSCSNKNMDCPINNLNITKCNKSELNTFITPEVLRRPFDNHNEESNIFSEISKCKVNTNNVENIQGMVKYNDNLKSSKIDMIEKSSVMGKIDENSLKKNVEELYIPLNCISDKCINEQSEQDIQDNVLDIQEEVEANTNHYHKEDSISPKLKFDETNLPEDLPNSGHSSHIANENEFVNKLKIPRIISTEIVNFDLSPLHSSRQRKRSESNKDGNNSNDNEDIHNDAISNISTIDHKESKPSNEEKVQNMSVMNRRRLTAKRRLHIQKNDDDFGETTIEMWKFVQDMTQGVRVVLQRLDLSSIPGGVNRKNC